MGDFNYSDICWRSNIDKRKQFRRFLESIDNFLSQVVEIPRRNGVLLDLILTKEGLDDMKFAGSLCCSDYGIVELLLNKVAGERARL